MPLVLVFRSEVYYKVDRLLCGLTTQQKGTSARWYSNKTSLLRDVVLSISIPTKMLIKYFTLSLTRNISVIISDKDGTSGDGHHKVVIVIFFEPWSELRTS